MAESSHGYPVRGFYTFETGFGYNYLFLWNKLENQGMHYGAKVVFGTYIAHYSD
jgi:hypothetical protein